MKPRLFLLNDLWLMSIAAVVGLAPPIVALLSHANRDTWGEAVPFQGWLVAALVTTTTAVIVFAFYWRRLAWLKLYRYTTRHGIACFFEPKAQVYTQEEVERDTVTMLDQWVRYYLAMGRNETANINSGAYLRGSTCIFKPEHHWRELGPMGRLVRGLSGWNWAMVGQGEQRIEHTAFRHEMAHIHLNRMERTAVDEQSAHAVFKTAGVS